MLCILLDDLHASLAPDGTVVMDVLRRRRGVLAVVAADEFVEDEEEEECEGRKSPPKEDQR